MKKYFVWSDISEFIDHWHRYHFFPCLYSAGIFHSSFLTGFGSPLGCEGWPSLRLYSCFVVSVHGHFPRTLFFPFDVWTSCELMRIVDSSVFIIYHLEFISEQNVSRFSIASAHFPSSVSLDGRQWVDRFCLLIPPFYVFLGRWQPKDVPVAMRIIANAHKRQMPGDSRKRRSV